MFDFPIEQGRGNQDPRSPTTIIHTNLTLGRCLNGYYYRSTQVSRKKCHHVSSGSAHKVCPFFSFFHPFKASKIATTFMETIQNLHGIHNIILSDRDPIFTNNFWIQLFSWLGTQLAHSSSYHPQFNGKTKIVNKILEGYLCFLASDKHT
jgi:hypothetical protein